MFKRNTTLLIVSGVLFAFLVGAAFYYNQTRIRTIVIATNDSNTSSYKFISALQQVAAHENVRLKIQIIETAGSVEIMDQLKQKKADFGVAQLDTPVAPNVDTVAFLYPQVYHLIVHADSDIHTPADLKGHRVATSSQGGGTYNSLLLWLDYYGLGPDTVTVMPMKSSDRETAFRKGDVDAIFRVVEMGTPDLKKFLQTVDARLVPFTQYDAMHLYFPTLLPYTIPLGTYRGANPALPDADLPTVGVPTVLFVNDDVDPAIVRSVTELLFENKSDIAVLTSLGAATIKPDVETVVAPRIHPGALAYYNRDQPSFFERHYKEISFTVTILPLMISVFFGLRARLLTQQRNRAYRYNLQMASLLAQLMSSPSEGGAKKVELQLLELLEEAIRDMNNGEVDYSELQAFSFAWDKAMEAVRRLRETTPTHADAPQRSNNDKEAV